MEKSFDKLINRVLDGRYKIENVLGIGGMAYVLKASDIKENRTVAIKILNDEFNTDELAVKRFVNESKAVSMLSCPNVVKIYDIVITNTLKYIVMEYIDGITLKDYIDKVGALSWKEAVHYVRQILIGLSHAHEKGIIHRDIKPQNIMLLKDGHVKVTDFGIAKMPKAESLTLPDNAIGTVNYVSPEQASGKTVDHKSDIYSVGVMLYEMVTGVLPFVADSPVAVAMKQVNEQPQSPRQKNPQIPIGLEQIILKSMSKDPEHRFANAAAMVKALEYFAKNPSVVFAQGEHTPIPPKTPGAKKQNKSENKTMLPMILGVTMAFFVVMAGVIAYFVFSRGIIGDKSHDNKDRSVVVESFIGEIYSEDFVRQIEDKGYTVIRCHNVREASLPENSIVRQDPEAGSTKLRPKDGSKIEVTLYVNYGLSEIMMPDCEATKIDDATRVIENQFNMYLTKRYDPDNITIIEQPDETVPKGYVISSIPQANKKIKISNDLKVTLYVSTGPENQVILMPDVTGKTQDEAKRIIEESGLSIGQIHKVESDKYSAGYVVSTSVQAGTEVETNVTAIDLYVSRTQDVIFQEKPSENQDDKTGIDSLLDLRDQQ